MKPMSNTKSAFTSLWLSLLIKFNQRCLRRINRLRIKHGG